MPKIDVVIPPRAKPIMEDESRDIVLIAHRRWLKTRLGILKCMYGNKKLKGAIKDRKVEFFVILPTYKQAKMVAWNILKDYALPYPHKANESELIVKYFNGSQISLKGADNPDSLRGGGLDGCIFDEWAFFKDPEVATKIIGPSLVDRQGWTLKTTTLDGKNHAWTDYLTAQSKYLFKASESGVIPAEELAREKSRMSEDEYNQEYECVPIHYSGQIYKEFNEQRNLVDEFEVPASWTHIVALDWGLSHNTAIMFCAVDYDGNFYVYDEYVNNDKPVEHYAEIIKSKMKGREFSFFVSPDTIAKDHYRNGVRYSIFLEFGEQGLSPIVANDQVSGGINKVKQLLLSGELRIFRRCAELRAGLDRYRWKVSEGKDVPVNIKNDEVDSLRYGVATYFEAPEMPKPKITFKNEDGSVNQEAWELMEKQLERRRYAEVN